MDTGTGSRTERAYEQFLMLNYGVPPLTLVRGEGARVWDDTGKEYLDFTSGIAVNALGHSHPVWVKAVQEQAATFVHCSNLYRNEPQGQLAERLSKYTGAGRFLFCNSGAEANEGLIKLARLHGKRKAGEEGKCFEIIVAENAFHGRTFGGMAATPQEKIQGGFRPMLDGFKVAKLNDLDSFRAQITDTTAAIFVETIQGEGGINAADHDFLRGLRTLCDEHEIMLILDEVQCGAGRSGKFFAFEHAGIKPDAIGMAKGLGGGFPIGAIWAAPDYAELFQAGMHGTTFGGNALACRAALAVLDVIEQDHLLDQITTQSADWHQQLSELVDSSDRLIGLRGAGYLVGLQLNEAPLEWIGKLRDAGMLCPPAGNNVVRLLPPLTATPNELTRAVDICRQVFTS